jgi:hypothetical protein
VLASTKGGVDSCGRPIQSLPEHTIDIPRVIPFAITVASPVVPGTQRIANSSQYPFYCVGMGIAPATLPSFRVKWPNGYYLSLGPLTPTISGGPVLGPVGQASNMLGFRNPVLIPAGERISVETSGAAGLLSLNFYGYLRVPVSSSQVQTSLQAEKASGRSSAVSCLIGYPTPKGDCLIGYPIGGDKTGAAQDRSQVAQSSRYHCNGNILAPEFRLGNQCHDGTPAGYQDEPFNFFSDPIVVTPSTTSTQNIVIVPGVAGSLTIVRRIRAKAVWSKVLGASAPDGVPTLALRTPEGRSVTFADQVPVLPFSWMPFFPSLPLRAGGRLVLDVGTLGATPANTVQISTVFEFEGVKRTVKSQ